MKIINKSGKAQNIKLGRKWIHFMDGQVKEGFPEDFLKKHKEYQKKFKEVE